MFTNHITHILQLQRKKIYSLYMNIIKILFFSWIQSFHYDRCNRSVNQFKNLNEHYTIRKCKPSSTQFNLHWKISSHWTHTSKFQIYKSTANNLNKSTTIMFHHFVIVVRNLNQSGFYYYLIGYFQAVTFTCLITSSPWAKLKVKVQPKTS